MPEKRKVISRIPVEPEILRRLRRFSQGAGVSYNEVLKVLLDDLVKPGEDEVIAGHRYWQEHEQSLPYDDDPAWNASIARSLPALQRLADKAVEDFKAGRTTELDPDKLP